MFGVGGGLVAGGVGFVAGGEFKKGVEGDDFDGAVEVFGNFN